MQKTLAFALCAAVGTAVSAHPFGEQWSSKSAPGPVGGGVDAPVELDEDFESYSVGAGMTSMGGWELWDDPAALDATITERFAASGTKSADFSRTGADIIHQFSGITSGQVTFSAMTYIPSTADGAFYLIALNRYDQAAGTTSWSMQVRFDPFLGIITSEFDGETTPVIYNEWVEFRAEINLDTDTFDLYYDDVLFVDDDCWTCTVQTGQPAGTGSLEFKAIDLYTQTSLTGNDFYLDDIRVETTDGGCYADCDSTGTLDFFDFLCFQNAFAAGESYADCDQSGTLDFFDFLCYQDAFAAGCP